MDIDKKIEVFGRMGKALSQFMLQLVSSNSKYDKVMRGEASFILPEQLGYDIFKKKCISNKGSNRGIKNI